MMSQIISVTSSNAQFSTIEASSERKIYGCDSYGDTVHCDPIPNEWDSYSVDGVETEIYPIIRSNEKADNEEKYSKVLELNEQYREYLEIPYIDHFDLKRFALSFSLKPGLEGSPYGHIISHVNKNQTAGWFIDETNINTENSASGSLRFVVVNNTGGLSSVSVNKTGSEFIHLVATFDGSLLKVYKNGTLSGEERFNGNYTADPELPIRIGSAAYCLSCNRWSGAIDDVRFYNNSLTSRQAHDLFSNSSNTTSHNLVAYYNFDNNAYDTTGNNNHGSIFTLVGSMVFSPDNRLFFSEKNTGKIKIMKDDKVLQNPFVQISDYYVDWEQGLLGLAIDPKFEQNHFVYLYYTYLDANSGIPYNRVVRFTETNNTATDMVILLNNIPASRGFHSGGALAFGSDDKLYITVGDATRHIEAQNASSLLGKILRINRDGTIPNDNPFPDSPVYTLGHRNMYGIAFDKNTGLGIVTENGDALYDEINLIQKSGNYGFPTFQPPNVSPELSNSSSSIVPVVTYSPVIVPTQAIYYDGNKIKQFTNSYLFGSFNGRIYSLNIDTNSAELTERKIELELFPFEGITSIAQSPTGDIYFGGYSIFRLKSTSIEPTQQVLFPFEVISSNNIKPDIMNLYANKTGATLDLSFDYSNRHTTTGQADESITIMVPGTLFASVKSAVLSIAPDKEVEPDIEINKASNSDYLTIVIPLQGLRPSKLSISADIAQYG
jgi:glucose/arabinose dehydrogenase